MALQNFVDKAAPVISAAWLNQVDILKETIFAAATTKALARTALTSDLPLEIANGGTAARTAAAAATALGVPSLIGNNALSGNNTLSGNNSFTGTNTVANVEPRWLFNETDAAADKKLWDVDVQASIFKIRTRTDADTVGKDVFAATRGVTTALSSVDIGNSTDLAPVNLRGVSTAYDPSTLVQKTLATMDSGTFTGTLTGCTTSPTGVINWTRVGNVVTLEIPSITATSNSNACTITGLPASLTPVRTQSCPARGIEDNTVQQIGVVIVSGVVLTLGTGNAAAFTAAGTKGITGSNMSYTLT